MRKHYYTLDLLKFLCAVVIVLIHFQSITNTKFANLNFFFGRIDFTWCVEFFFIISGFVSAAGLKAKLPEFRIYALRKAVRLYPMVWLSVSFSLPIICFYRHIFGILPAGVKYLGAWNVLNSFLLTYAGGGYT